MSTTFLLLYFFFFTITCNPTTTIAQTPAATSPQPSDFADIKLFQAYQVIQLFKSTIICDPQGVTATWTVAGICQGRNYRGFFCESPPYNASAITVAGVDFNGFGLCAPTIAGFVDQLPDLGIFHVNSNNFTGIVPDLSNLPFLFELDLSNNLYSTRFPSNVSQLLYLDLRFNAFAGTLPPSVFSANNLDITFERVCALPKLQNLSLSSNYLTMVGPKCRQLIRKGVLNVRGNCIPGLPMQRTFHDCAGFHAHDAYHCPLPSTYYYVLETWGCDNPGLFSDRVRITFRTRLFDPFTLPGLHEYLAGIILRRNNLVQAI